MKLASLFDGVGGFPYAAQRHGIEPVWASEIEKGPIEITQKHFPNMKHYGDVTKINGAEVEPVDIITFGSPCQDMSIAGKMAGLEGERSGLFMEAVRIIKEMRDATEGTYPRFAVWENVPGAFSSNKGEDFRTVIEELCRISEAVSIPKPPENSWTMAGTVVGNGYSIAWRTLDAQYWGVPQRRKRIFLVADFGSERAAEILFERESKNWNFTQSESAGEGIAADAERSARAAGFKWGNSKDARSIGYEEELSPTLAGSSGGNMVPAIVYDMTHAEEVMRTVGGDKVNTLNGRMGTGGNQVQVVCQPVAIQHSIVGRKDEAVVKQNYKVRRLVPVECERLQGYPDFWTDGQSDTVRYKALGNSVAIPCVEFVIGSIVRFVEGETKCDTQSNGG